MEKKDLRIVFLGTPDFAVESLRRIVDEGYNVVGVVTMPDKPAGRGHRMYQSPVKEFALDRGLKLMQPVSLKDPEFVGELRSLDADLFVVIAFRMLPEVVWTMPRLGTFNLHASLLPRYRGAAPINWAVINGDRETGVTTFFLKHEIDTGDIIRQERIEIGEDENVGSVHDRLMALGAELTLDTIGHILAGDLVPQSQDTMPGGEAPTLAPKIFRNTCHLDFCNPAEKVRNLIRGLSPYPAAWCELRDASESGSGQAPLSTLKVYESKRAGETALAPGEVSVADGRMLVGCGDGNALELVEVQPSGKRRMTAGEFLRGARLPQRLVMG